MGGLSTGLAHVKGKNDISLGVCLIGRSKFTKKIFILEKLYLNGNYILKLNSWASRYW